MFEYSLQEEAQQDIEESLLWYKEKSTQVADNFLSEIDNAIQKICTQPTHGKNKYKNYYDFHLKRFPFTIVYIIDNDEQLVIVSAVFHNMRNPTKKYRRNI